MSTSSKDEFSIVPESEIGFRSNDHEVVLGPGGYIVKPRGEIHALWNAGSTPAPTGCWTSSPASTHPTSRLIQAQIREDA